MTEKIPGALSPPLESRIQKFWDAQAEWSRATFGADSERDHIGPLKHLAKEAVEAQTRPADYVEIADCLFLVFDAARRSGMTLEMLVEIAEKKLVVNKARTWQKPTDDNPVEHVRESVSPPLESDTKHTSGPWSWIKTHGQHIVECQKETIAHIDTLNEADAYLISAAPDLLEALEKIRNLERRNFREAWDMLQEVDRLAGTAIRKAKGDSQ